MAILTSAPRGTQDILPENTYKWQYVQKTLLETASLFGFEEIRTPTFEHTELFLRSVGDTTDVVNKEMYTFLDKGDRSITLRPEGTAGVARAAIENGIINGALPLKLSYMINCFRYEKKQKGRFREFNQFGVEMYGANSPIADAEVIALANECYNILGLDNIRLEINSIGCPECRKKYHEALKQYLGDNKEHLCPTCHERFDKNPMRILDCKEEKCKEITKNAPLMLDYLCDDCKAHFEQVKSMLDNAKINYTVNPTIVRGLDYYTRTVFEFICTDSKGDDIVAGGGGRYGGLLNEIGGPDLEGIGFAMGIERVLMLMEDQHCDFPERLTCDVYIIPMGTNAINKAFVLANSLREEGFAAQCDLIGKSVKAQMKYANKIGAKYTMVIGDSELEGQKAKLKCMYNGEEIEVSIGDDFRDTIYDVIMESSLEALHEAAEKL